MNISNLPWIEKYRPKTMDDMIDHEEKINTLKNLIHKNELPHLLFYGPPGTGKTSLILAAAREMYGNEFKIHILELNASDDRGIDIVRNKIPNFVKTKSNKLRLVILDEADAMTQDAQSALRRVMEKYINTSRFCLICNNFNKIIPGIKSRCSIMRFGILNALEVQSKIRQITDKEHVQITDEAITTLINVQKDFRQILNTLQCLHYIRIGNITSNVLSPINNYTPAPEKKPESGSGVNVHEDAGNNVDTEYASDLEKTKESQESLIIKYEPIEPDDIFLYLGKPSKSETNKIISDMFNGEFQETYQKLLGLFRENRWNILDLIGQLGKEVIGTNDMKNEQKFYLLQKLSKIEYRVVNGRDSEIQLGALVAAFLNSKNKICKA